MRIGIDIRPTLKQKTGIGYYTLNLINHLAKIDSHNQYLLYSKLKPFKGKKRLPNLPGENFCHRINRFNRPLDKVMGKIDVFFTSSHDLSALKACRSIVVVHDVIHKAFPEGHTQETIERSIHELKRVLEYTDTLITTTHCTKMDLVKWYSVPEERIKVIHLGASEELHPIEKSSVLCQKLMNKYNLPGSFSSYFLYVGTIEPRKNLSNLIKAYDILKKKCNIKVPLLVVGMKGWMYTEVFELTKKLNLENDVFFLGYVEREDINLFYSLARVFVYPSFYEGAGIPILEAFKCATPVITSTSCALAEIAGDAAILVDPYKPEEIAQAIGRVIDDDELCIQLQQKGLERVKKFGWDSIAREMLEIFVG